MFKQKLLNWEPIDLSRFVMDVRDRHLKFWTHFSNSHPRERNSKTLGFSGTCFLTFLDSRHVIRSVARFRLRVHTLRVEIAT